MFAICKGHISYCEDLQEHSGFIQSLELCSTVSLLSKDIHQEVINRIVEIQEEYNEPIGILADLQGPKLRVGEIKVLMLLSSWSIFPFHVST